MIKLFFISSLLIVFHVYNNDIFVYWEERNIVTWDDFKKVKNLKGDEAAYIRVATHSEFEYQNDSLTVTIRTYMDPKNSFVEKDNESDYLLKHEQLHFDIQEIYSRKMRKRIKETNLSFNSLSKELDIIFKEEMKRAEEFQNQYDKETNHSLNKEVQQKWEQKVIKELDNLSDYKEPTFRVFVEN
ncbi:MAG: hypothetical protein Kow0068_16090 [Marinilabiliales bacterium]